MKCLIVLTFISALTIKVNCQNGFYDRYSIIKPTTKIISEIKIHDELTKKDIIFNLGIKKVDLTNYLSSIYSNGSLFLLLKSHNTSNNELWMYFNNSAKLITVGNNLNVSVSPKCSQISFVSNGDSAISIYSLISNKIEQRIKIHYDGDSWISLLKWSSNEKVLWYSFAGIYCQEFGLYKFDIGSKKVIEYNNSMSLCYSDFNPDKELYVYSDYIPPISEGADDDDKDTLFEKTLVNLIVYNINTEKHDTIQSDYGVYYAPKWISEDYFEYYDKGLNRRILKKYQLRSTSYKTNSGGSASLKRTAYLERIYLLK